MVRVTWIGLLGLAMVVGIMTQARQTHAGLILMSSDGVSSFNIGRAGTLGHTVSSNSIAGIVGTPVSTLSGYDVVWINPGFTNYGALRAGVGAGGNLNQYVLGGGVLVLNVAGNSGSQADIAPGGVDYSRATLHESETFTAPAHPYLTGVGYAGSPLATSDFVNWFYTDHGTLQNLVSGTTTVLSNAHGPSFVEYSFGNGTVILNTLTYGWGSNGARLQPLNNLINYSVFASQQNAVPEPSSLAIFGIGACVAGIGMMRRRRTRKRNSGSA